MNGLLARSTPGRPAELLTVHESREYTNRPTTRCCFIPRHQIHRLLRMRNIINVSVYASFRSTRQTTFFSYACTNTPAEKIIDILRSNGSQRRRLFTSHCVRRPPRIQASNLRSQICSIQRTGQFALHFLLAKRRVLKTGLVLGDPRNYT